MATTVNMPRRNMGYPAHISFPVPAADEVVIQHSAIALVRSQLSNSSPLFADLRPGISQIITTVRLHL
jgi:hypothetical protein